MLENIQGGEEGRCASSPVGRHSLSPCPVRLTCSQWRRQWTQRHPYPWEPTSGCTLHPGLPGHCLPLRSAFPHEASGRAMHQQVQLAQERPPLRSKLCSSHRRPPALFPAEATCAALHLRTGLAKRFNRITNQFLNLKKILQTQYFCLFFL